MMENGTTTFLNVSLLDFSEIDMQKGSCCSRSEKRVPYVFKEAIYGAQKTALGLDCLILFPHKICFKKISII